MEALRKPGGAAAITAAATYIFGFVLFFGVIDTDGYDGVAGQLAFAIENEVALTFAMIGLYLVFGTVLLILNGALNECLEHEQPGWNRIASGFGICWAAMVFASGMIGLGGLSYVGQLAIEEPDRAATIWAALSIVQDGLGGGIEFVGGVWIALMSWLLLKSGTLPRALNWFGLAIGLAGIATTLPQARDLAAIFGISQIVWFAWIGTAMWKTVPASTD